jgi:hypothetical protein
LTAANCATGSVGNNGGTGMVGTVVFAQIPIPNGTMIMIR